MASCRHAVLEDQLAERHDEPGRFGDRDELVGSDDAANRDGSSARSASSPATWSVARSMTGWYTTSISSEPSATRSSASSAESLLDDDLHRRLELQQPPASLAFRGVQGDVGVAQQVGRAGAVADEVGTGGATEHDRSSGHHDRSGDRRPTAVATIESTSAVSVRVGEEDRELVATHAGDEIGGTNGCPQAPGHLDEHLVAGLVAERVVHRLEPVEIQARRPLRPVLQPIRVSLGSDARAAARAGSGWRDPVSGSWNALCASSARLSSSRAAIVFTTPATERNSRSPVDLDAMSQSVDGELFEPRLRGRGAERRAPGGDVGGRPSWRPRRR